MTQPQDPSKLDPSAVRVMCAEKQVCFIHISMGGPEFDIQADGKRYHFEMHPYCGPIRLNKNGSEHCSQPMAFLHAVSLWAQQGQRVEDGLCRWDHEPEEILKHLGGNNYQLVGHHPAKRGE
jgi:hypothetical protein